MDVYEAIKQMKELSNKGESFSFAFMSYSYDRKKSDGVVKVMNARLTKKSTRDKNRFADYMLNYIDLNTLERRTCWEILLLEFNGHELTLN